MEYMIVGALIAATTSAIQGVAAPLVIAFVERRRLMPKPPLLVDAFCGHWQGWVEDKTVEGGVPSERNSTLTMILTKKAGANVLQGTFTFKSHETGQVVHGILDNGIIRDRYVTFHYFNKDPLIQHYGGVVLRLDGNCTNLAGFHTGASPSHGRFVNGELGLTKQA